MRWLANENFKSNIVEGLLRQKPALDIVRAQDTDIAGASDTAVVDWATRQGRLLLSHDMNTLIACVYQRILRGHPVPGVFECGHKFSVASAIEEILMIDACSEPSEWEGQVVYLPLR